MGSSSAKRAYVLGQSKTPLVFLVTASTRFPTACYNIQSSCFSVVFSAVASTLGTAVVNRICCSPESTGRNTSNLRGLSVTTLVQSSACRSARVGLVLPLTKFPIVVPFLEPFSSSWIPWQPYQDLFAWVQDGTSNPFLASGNLHKSVCVRHNAVFALCVHFSKQRFNSRR